MTESEKFYKFMTSQIEYVISLKTVTDKKKNIKNLLDNMEFYSGTENDKRLTKDNLQYAMQQKTAGKINEVLKISLNALKTDDKMGNGGEVGHKGWTPEQSRKVAELDADFEKAVSAMGISRNSKEAADLWRSGGFQKRMGAIFGKTYVSDKGGKSGTINLIEEVKAKYPKTVREYGVTEAFIDPYGEFRLTSKYDVPMETASEMAEYFESKKMGNGGNVGSKFSYYKVPNENLWAIQECNPEFRDEHGTECITIKNKKSEAEAKAEVERLNGNYGGISKSEYEKLLSDYDKWGAYLDDAETPEEKEKYRKLLKETEDKIHRAERPELYAEGGEIGADKKAKIDKLKKAIASPATPANVKKAMESALEKLQKEIIEHDMKKFKEGKLKTSAGKVVKKREQAVAISLSQSGKSKKQAPKKAAKKAPTKSTKPAKQDHKTQALLASLKGKKGFEFLSKTPKENLKKDIKRKAKKAGKRVSADGNVYYEYRRNRTDVNRKIKLAEGGTIDNAELLDVTGVRDGKRVTINKKPLNSDEAYEMVVDAKKSGLYFDVRTSPSMYSQGGEIIGENVNITDKNSLFKGKSGVVTGTQGKMLMVKILVDGGERTVMVNKKGVKVIK